MSFEKELKEILKKEELNEWKLNLNRDYKAKGWDGIALAQSKTIHLSFNKDTNCFHGFLHELAHAIEIEKRPNKKGDSHDVFYADTLTKLIGKYCLSKKKFRETIDNKIDFLQETQDDDSVECLKDIKKMIDILKELKKELRIEE